MREIAGVQTKDPEREEKSPDAERMIICHAAIKLLGGGKVVAVNSIFLSSRLTDIRRVVPQ